MTVERHNGQEFVWYSSLSEVPGIEWRSPEGIEVEPPLSNARPVFRVDGLTKVSWVFEDGSLLPDAGYSSPAKFSSNKEFNGESLEDLAHEVAVALSLPGTKPDYFEAITKALGEFWRLKPDPLTSVTQVHLALLAVDLFESGLSGGFFDGEVPYRALFQIYLSEGFLLEAGKARRANQEISQGAWRGDDRLNADPRDLIEGLDQLRKAVDWPE